MNRRRLLKWLFCGGTLVGGYSLLIERYLVQVNHYTIPIIDLPSSFQNFTIAHLTDIHFGFLVSESFVNNIIHQTNNLKTDIIVCTGDFVHERNILTEIDKVWPILAQLQAKYGVYSVLGNHDHWADFERSVYWLERTGQNLRHRYQFIEKGTDRIVIGGAGDFWEDTLEIDEIFSSSDQEECKILLSHNPDAVDTTYQTTLSLVLSGHTHGGQVVIPGWGPPIIPVINKKYSSGLIQTSKTLLFISRGLGWTIYPIRFNCYPELAVLHLVNPNLMKFS